MEGKEQGCQVAEDGCLTDAIVQAPDKTAPEVSCSDTGGSDTPGSERTDASDSSHEVTEAPPTPPPDPKPKDTKKSKKTSSKKQVSKSSAQRGTCDKINSSVTKDRKRKADLLVNGDVGHNHTQIDAKADDLNLNHDTEKPKPKKAKKQSSENSNAGLQKSKKKCVKQSKHSVPVENGSIGDSSIKLAKDGEVCTVNVKENSEPVSSDVADLPKSNSDKSMDVDSQSEDIIGNSSKLVQDKESSCKNDADGNLRDDKFEDISQQNNGNPASPLIDDSDEDDDEDDEDDESSSSDSSLSSDENEDMAEDGVVSDVSHLTRLNSLASDGGTVLGTDSGLIGAPPVGRPEDLPKAQNKDDDDGDSADKPYSCPQCSYRGRKKGQLRKHLAVHNLFPCAHCDFTAETRESLQEHMKENHPSRTGRKLCKKCSVLFLADELDEHEAACTGEKKMWTCKECGKSFKFVCALKSHVHRWHTKEGLEASKRFPCDQCDFRGVFMRDLKQHQNAVHRPPDVERTVKCTECTSTFYNKDELKRHVRECHTEDRPHVCHMCDKAFKTKTHLKNHYNTHNPSDTFKCDIEGCTSTFKAEKYMERHRVDIHKLPPRRKRTPHPCSFPGCSEIFNKKSHLKRHELTHTGEREFPCEWPDCNKVFRHSDNLKVHMLRHQGEKTIKCELCDNAYYQKSGLRYHMRKTHGIRIVSAKTKQKEEEQAAAAAAAASEESSVPLETKPDGDSVNTDDKPPSTDEEQTTAAPPLTSSSASSNATSTTEVSNKDVYDFNDSDDDKVNIQIRQATPVRSPRVSDETSVLKSEDAESAPEKETTPKTSPKKTKKVSLDGDSADDGPKKKKSKPKSKAKVTTEEKQEAEEKQPDEEAMSETEVEASTKANKKGSKAKASSSKKAKSDKKTKEAEKKALKEAEKKAKEAEKKAKEAEKKAIKEAEKKAKEAAKKEKAAEKKAKAKKSQSKKSKSKSKKKTKAEAVSDDEMENESTLDIPVEQAVNEDHSSINRNQGSPTLSDDLAHADDMRDRSPPMVDLMVPHDTDGRQSSFDSENDGMVVDTNDCAMNDSLPVLSNETEPSNTELIGENAASGVGDEEIPHESGQDIPSSPAASSAHHDENDGDTSDDSSHMQEEFTNDMYEMPRAPAPPPTVSSDEEEDEVMPVAEQMPPANEVPVIVAQNQPTYDVSDSTNQDCTPPSVAPPSVAPPSVAPPSVAPPSVAPPSVAPPSGSEIPPTPTERSSLDYPMQTPLSEPYSVPPPSYGERRSSYGAEITSPHSVKPHDRSDMPSNDSGAANYGYPDSSTSYPGSYPPQQQQQQQQPQQHGVPMPGSVEAQPQQDMHINSVPPPTGSSYSSNEPENAYHPPSVSQHQSEPFTPGATTVSYSYTSAADPLTSSKSQENYGDSLPRLPEGPTYLPTRTTASAALTSTTTPSSTINSFGTDTFPSSRDFFGQYFQDPSTLPLTHPPLSAQDQSRLPTYQQQPLSALQHTNADFLRRASLMPGATYAPSVTESLIGMTPGLPQPAQHNWMTDDRSRHWGQPSPMLMPSDIDKTSPLSRNPYSSEYGFDASNPSSQISKRPSDSSFPAQTTTASTDRYDLTYMSSRTFNPSATGSNYPRSVGANPSSQKHFEEAYRQAASHISDYRSITQAPPPPAMHDMYSRMGMSMGLDKYYYPREAMYRSQHSLPSAPHPFMPPTSSAQMPVYGDRDYARNAAAAAMYPQHSAYSFMSDKQYLSAAVGNKVPQPPAPHGMPGAEYLQPPTAAPSDMQDPYRRSVIYNMMPRYF